jgi:DNA-binding LacI/PurR family transcriptional regulator
VEPRHYQFKEFYASTIYAYLSVIMMKCSFQARGTLRDVAQAVGVSHTTVSNAFNRPYKLSAELREKILSAARSLNYSGPNPAARMLSTGFAGTVGLLYPGQLQRAFQDPATTAFLGGVAEACAERGLGLLLLQGRGASERIIQTAAVDGFIIYSMLKDDLTIQAIVNRALPVVTVDQPLLPRIPLVGIDDRAGARACAQHLIDLGHKKFGIVTFGLGRDGYCGPIGKGRLKGATNEVAVQRIKGYLDVLEHSRAGISVRLWESPLRTDEDGRMAGASLLEGDPPPTAILAMSDRLAIGVMKVAGERKLRIPEDLAVAGFDDIPAAQVIAPQLTTVHQPAEEKGRVAIASLLKEKGPLRRRLPIRLVVRQSTAAGMSATG